VAGTFDSAAWRGREGTHVLLVADDDAFQPGRFRLGQGRLRVADVLRGCGLADFHWLLVITVIQGWRNVARCVVHRRLM
jgi:hypothetical protein